MCSQDQVVYVVSRDLVKYASLLPSNVSRSVLVHTLAKAFGLLSRDYSPAQPIQPVEPRLATIEDLSLFHTQDYLDAVLQDPRQTNLDSTDFGLEDDCPRFLGLPEYARLVAGATITAANSLHSGYATTAINWEGGRHHAQKSRASGFCYVADCVLAILLLQKTTIVPAAPLTGSLSTSPTQHKKQRVMYLDLDVHFADGVANAFYSSTSSNSKQVLTFSIHHAAPGFFPSSPLAQLPLDPSVPFDPFTLSLPLLEGASAKTFASIWPHVERIKNAFNPDYIVIQCGVDGLAGDTKCKVFNWCLDIAIEGSLGWCVSRIVNEWKGSRKLFLGGGGYHAPNAARAWSYLTSIILKKPLDVSVNIPDDPTHSAFPLYAPTFTLDVPAGNMVDKNTSDYLADVQTRFERVSEILEGVLRTQQS
ncbi:hypothetical protein FB446DRAFT_742043 [Lentinula raphanica]|nr:hypothetical protein FB446DRAFT_742043 [Lentinula raphanica]